VVGQAQENKAGENLAEANKENPKSAVCLFKDGRMLGPFSLDQIRKYLNGGSFEKSDQACWDGKNWKTIAEIPGIEGKEN
jgi:hypothetical protein